MESTQRHLGRTVLITGAARGLGQEYARRLAGEGARIISADVISSAETLEIVEEVVAQNSADEAQRAAQKPLAFDCDLASPDSIVEMARSLEGEEVGVDVLIHNAAIAPLGGLLEADFDLWRKIMSVNLDSFFLLSKAFVPAMIERGWGRVIGISSGMVQAGSPGSISYVSSKAGIIGFVRALANEVGANGVTVNAVAPGLTVTPGSKDSLAGVPGLYEQLASVQAIKRNGQPEDLSGAISFLASDDAAWMTGQTVLIDGGLSFI